MAEMLARFGSTVFANSLAYGQAQRTATQLKDSVAARAVTDQAKGILMHALGCDADEALRYLRRESQRRHVKVTEVAARVIATYAPGGRGSARLLSRSERGLPRARPPRRRWLRTQFTGALLRRGAAPDADRLAGPHREVEALLPDRAACADPQRLGDLLARGGADGEGEEQVGVGGEAGARRAPVGGVLDHLASLR